MIKNLFAVLFWFLILYGALADNTPVVAVVDAFYSTHTNENLLVQVSKVEVTEKEITLTNEVLNAPFNKTHSTLTLHIPIKEHITNKFKTNDKLMFTESNTGYHLHKDNIVIG